MANLTGKGLGNALEVLKVILWAALLSDTFHHYLDSVTEGRNKG